MKTNKWIMTIISSTEGISVKVLNDKSNVDRAFGSTNVIRIKLGKFSNGPFSILWFKLIPCEWYWLPSLITLGAPRATRGRA